jgi:hypothetical protein
MSRLRVEFLILIFLLIYMTARPCQGQDNKTSGSFPNRPPAGSVSSVTDTIAPYLKAANKRFGIGINPLRSLIDIGYELNIRCDVSLFAVDNYAEISFPLTYIQGDEEGVPTYRVFYSEATYRRFFRNTKKGSYYSAGLRYRYLEGEQLISTGNTGHNYEGTGIVKRLSNIGIYAGIGYRHFSKKGWYGNLILGAYFGPKANNIMTSEDLPLNFILGADLFEIGYAF